jgi:hypothetical protein
VNGGDEDEGMWLMASSRGGDGGRLVNVQCKPVWNCHNNPLCTVTIS